jgi:hypothetical protein
MIAGFQVTYRIAPGPSLRIAQAVEFGVWTADRFMIAFSGDLPS